MQLCTDGCVCVLCSQRTIEQLEAKHSDVRKELVTVKEALSQLTLEKEVLEDEKGSLAQALSKVPHTHTRICLYAFIIICKLLSTYTVYMYTKTGLHPPHTLLMTHLLTNSSPLFSVPYVLSLYHNCSHLYEIYFCQGHKTVFMQI